MYRIVKSARTGRWSLVWLVSGKSPGRQPSNDPSQFEGEWYVNAAEPSGEFIVKYKARYDIMPTMGTPNMYDNFNLIVEGFERAGDGITKPTTEQVAHAISQIRGFPGVLGNLDVGEEGIVWSPAVIRMIKDGKPVTISE